MKRIFFTAIAAVVLAFAFIAASSVEHHSLNKNETAAGYKIGDAATDFKLKNVDGKLVSLSDYKTAKGFIVIFTCNECPYAKGYENRIIALDAKYKKQGYPVIAINPSDPVKQPSDALALMQKRAKEKGFTFPYLVDEGQAIYPQYGAQRTPHVFLLQKDGDKNIVRYIGAIDNNHEDETDASEKYVEKAVNALLTNKKIAVETTVAVGCGIKPKG